MKPLRSPGEAAPSIGARHLATRVHARLFEDEAPPVTAGRFTIVDKIGTGGMSVVYRAEDPELGRAVALKVLPRRLWQQTARLRREAKSLARIKHPNVVTIYEVGTEGKQPFIAMEWVEGGSLRDWCNRAAADGSPRTERLTAMFREAALGLQAAHDVGIIHRDLKPENILVGADDRVRIADFGLAVPPPSAEDSPPDAMSDRDTRPGATPGTPLYMAPEQHAGCTDERSDQFSLCLTFAEAMAGRHPFGNDAATITDNLRRGQMVAARQIHGRIGEVLARGMASDPAARFDSMQGLLEALQRRAPTRRRWLGAAGLGVALAVWFGLSGETEPCEPDEARLGEVWSPAIHEDLERAFHSRGDRGRADWSVIGHELEAAIEMWRVQNVRACEEARNHDAQRAERGRLALACSSRAVAAIDSVVANLRHEASPGEVRLSGLNGVITELVDCDDRWSPEDSDAFDVGVYLDRALISQTLGNRAAVAHWMNAALQDSRIAELPAARATAHLGLAWAARSQDDQAAEREQLHAGLAAAEAADEPNRIAQIWGDLGALESRAGNDERALFHLERAQRYVDENRLSPRRRAGTLMIEGQIHDRAGRTAESVAAFTQAVEQYREVLPSSAMLAWAISNLAAAKGKLGDTQTAIALSRESVDVMRKALAPGHPDIGVVTARLGVWLEVAGDCDNALPSLADALAIFERDPAAFPEERAAAVAARARCTGQGPR